YCLRRRVDALVVRPWCGMGRGLYLLRRLRDSANELPHRTRSTDRRYNDPEMSGERHDLVVIGGGLAGLAAAVRSSELGLRVVVLEAGNADRYLCNSRIAMGFFNVAFRDIWEGKDVLQRAINTVTAGTADSELAEALSQNAGHALAWLRS